MNREELYNMLDIESGADFEYFENLAAFFECSEEIDYQQIAGLLEEVDKDNLAELLKNYFDEITDFIPGSEGELYTVLDNIQRALIGLCRNYHRDEGVSQLAEEMDRFRRWYSIESKVYYNPMGESKENVTTVANAILMARIEKLGGQKNIYDFSECLDYKIDEYIMSIADMIFAGNEDEENPDNLREDEY